MYDGGQYEHFAPALSCLYTIRIHFQQINIQRQYNVIRVYYLVPDYNVDGDRTQKTGDGSDPVRNAHQYTGVSRCDVQMIYVEP